MRPIGVPRTNSTTELAKIYRAVDLVINPTLEDTSATTNLEALACGTPVVTYDCGGCTECLDDGCGLVVERGDLQGLVAAVAMVRKGGKESYTVRCQKLAKDRFDKDARYAEYLALYRSYLE